MDDSNELDSWKHLLVLENIGHDDILVVHDESCEECPQ